MKWVRSSSHVAVIRQLKDKIQRTAHMWTADLLLSASIPRWEDLVEEVSQRSRDGDVNRLSVFFRKLPFILGLLLKPLPFSFPVTLIPSTRIGGSFSLSSSL